MVGLINLSLADLDVGREAAYEKPVETYRRILRGIQTAVAGGYSVYFAPEGFCDYALPTATNEVKAFDTIGATLEIIQHTAPDFVKPSWKVKCADCDEEVDIIDSVHPEFMGFRRTSTVTPMDVPLLVKVNPDDFSDEYLIDGNYIALCKECSKHWNVQRCATCNTLFIADDGETYHGEYYCGECVEDWDTCTDCGRLVPDFAQRTLYNGDVICDDCYGENYFTCDRCGEIYHMDDRYTYGSEWLCCDCAEEVDDYDRYDEEEAYVHVYNWKPRGIFYDSEGKSNYSSDKLYYGIELEVSGSHRHAPDFLSFFNDTDFGNETSVYLKSDCSIREGGFEIVTHPMTFDYIKDTFMNTMSEALQDLRKKHFRGHNYGGMHVHLSRSAVSFQQWDYISQMLAAPENKKAWLFLTQRKESEISQWARLNCRPAYSTEQAKRYYEGGSNFGMSRYVALNVTNNTVEFRIFNSNLRPERVMKNLEVCQSLYDFTKPVQRKNISMPMYIKYVRKHADRYPNLAAFLDEKDWDTEVAHDFMSQPDCIVSEA